MWNDNNIHETTIQSLTIIIQAHSALIKVDVKYYKNENIHIYNSIISCQAILTQYLSSWYQKVSFKIFLI